MGGLIVSALPGKLSKSKKAPEVDEDDAGSDSESEPSVVGSDDQAASEEDEEEAYDDEGFFCDVSFPAGIAALGDMSGDSANKAKGKVDRWQEQMLEGWARPHQMLGEKRTRTHKLYGMGGVEPCLFGQTSPNDLHQGSIGDCWLIAAMSALAEFPLLVHRLFKQQQLAPDGRYDVRLYDAETEEWQVLTIDDRLPFIKRKGYYGSMLFCKPTKEGEFWPCLLEKAFAKLLDGYWRLEGGAVAIAFEAMTGKPSIMTYLGAPDDESELPHEAAWCVYGEEYDSAQPKSFLMRNPGKDRNWSTWRSLDGLTPRFERVAQEKFDALDDEGLWEKLKAWDEAGYIMGLSSRCDYHGVIKGHAYTIVQVLEVAVDGHEDYASLRLLKVRNPHAGNEWSGSFSDADEESWGAHPEALEACGHEVGHVEDGFFWIRLEDLKQGFRKLHLNFQPSALESGERMARFDALEEGHAFSKEELVLEGHAWEVADGDADSEGEVGDDPEEIKGLVVRLKDLSLSLQDLPPGEERKAALRSINRKRRRVAAAPVPYGLLAAPYGGYGVRPTGFAVTAM